MVCVGALSGERECFNQKCETEVMDKQGEAV